MDDQTSATDDVTNPAAAETQPRSIEEWDNGKFPFNFFLLVLLEAHYATETSAAYLNGTNF